MSDGIQIERSKHAQEFVIIGNAQARDSRLSFRARGLHHHLLSLPPGWRVTTAQLAEDHPEGRDAIRVALNELIKLSYVTKDRRQDKAGRWSTTMTVHDKPQVSAGDTEDGIPGVGKPGVGIPGVGFPGVGFPGAIQKTEPKTVKEDDEKYAVVPEGRPGPEAMGSRRARTSGASARIFSDSDKIDGTRFAIAAVYGETWNKTISDEEVLALFTLKAPRNGKVTNVTAYMRKIFDDTPAFDTLLSQLDTELDGDFGDDYDLAAEGRKAVINGNYEDFLQNHPPCPRCDGMRYALGANQICAGCEAEIWSGRADPAGWNVSILEAVKTALFVTMGATVDDAWAARVATHILHDDKGKPREFKQAGAGPKVKYITTTISSDPNPGRFLPTYTPSAA